MSATFDESTLKKAFFEVLCHSNFSAFAKEGEENMSSNVLIATPVEMQEELPETLLESALFVCTKAPYEWSVNDTKPQIEKETTFKNLYDNWFRNILS